MTVLRFMSLLFLAATILAESKTSLPTHNYSHRTDFVFSKKTNQLKPTTFDDSTDRKNERYDYEYAFDANEDTANEIKYDDSKFEIFADSNKHTHTLERSDSTIESDAHDTPNTVGKSLHVAESHIVPIDLIHPGLASPPHVNSLFHGKSLRQPPLPPLQRSDIGPPFRTFLNEIGPPGNVPPNHHPPGTPFHGDIPLPPPPPPPLSGRAPRRRKLPPPTPDPKNPPPIYRHHTELKQLNNGKSLKMAAPKHYFDDRREVPDKEVYDPVYPRFGPFGGKQHLLKKKTRKPKIKKKKKSRKGYRMLRRSKGFLPYNKRRKGFKNYARSPVSLIDQPYGPQHPRLPHPLPPGPNQHSTGPLPPPLHPPPLHPPGPPPHHPGPPPHHPGPPPHHPGPPPHHSGPPSLHTGLSPDHSVPHFIDRTGVHHDPVAASAAFIDIHSPYISKYYGYTFGVNGPW